MIRAKRGLYMQPILETILEGFGKLHSQENSNSRVKSQDSRLLSLKRLLLK